MDVFQKTQMQSECNLWFEERRGRITGSYFGRIINRNPNTDPKSLLKSITRTSSIKKSAIVMGKQQEAQTLARYLLQQRENGNSDTSVQGAGFLIDKVYGWLGASPHAVVTDNPSKGCAEIKAAISLWNKSIKEAVSPSNRFCLNYDVNNTLHLKEKHRFSSIPVAIVCWE